MKEKLAWQVFFCNMGLFSTKFDVYQAAGKRSRPPESADRSQTTLQQQDAVLLLAAELAQMLSQGACCILLAGI